MAEAIFNAKGGPNFTGYSAGSHPAGKVHPAALKELESAGISTQGLRSKSWDEFEKAGAPSLDFVFTVCDNAAQEVCPVWPGHPMTAHWGIPDPAAVRTSQEASQEAFREAFFALDWRIGLFLNLPIAELDELALKRELRNIASQ